MKTFNAVKFAIIGATTITAAKVVVAIARKYIGLTDKTKVNFDLSYVQREGEKKREKKKKKYI